jgi:hypothetical protein
MLSALAYIIREHITRPHEHVRARAIASRKQANHNKNKERQRGAVRTRGMCAHGEQRAARGRQKTRLLLDLAVQRVPPQVLVVLHQLNAAGCVAAVLRGTRKTGGADEAWRRGCGSAPAHTAGALAREDSHAATRSSSRRARPPAAPIFWIAALATATCRGRAAPPREKRSRASTAAGSSPPAKRRRRRSAACALCLTPARASSR